MSENTRLKKAGLKVTAPRLHVLSMLEQATDRHVSAEDVYKSLLSLGEEVGLATVYRVLAQFEAAGIILRHNFEGGYSVYELTRETHHDHLVCIKCDRINEFVDDVIEQRQHAVAQRAKFKITNHALTIYGICHTCL